MFPVIAVKQRPDFTTKNAEGEDGVMQDAGFKMQDEEKRARRTKCEV